MNETRLFVLAALAKRGAMHGHQLRRDARLDRADLWSRVKPGSLYSALHRMEAEGLIRPLRTEQDGALPARTVYEITEEGLRELRALRDEAFTEVDIRPDPVDLALVVSADLDRTLLRGYFEDRLAALQARASRIEHHPDRQSPNQTRAEDLIVDHARMRLQSEIDWHQKVLADIETLELTAEHASSSE
ncbi:PadR family transcriptional regulator [Nocardia sp. NPDC006630]|uniref:PadR family transcriptional regulator n=1 Tax=Nocardia sp. NPDC006630 TaxID=3157181 RepID=UPI0033A6C0AD